jgi:hypothetical protein
MKSDFGKTAIITCCKNMFYDILSDFILGKYKHNYLELNIDDTDNKGRTGLMWMCLRIDGYKNDRDKEKQGRFIDYSLEHIQLMLDANASPLAMDRYGRTPLSISLNYSQVYDKLIRTSSYILK